MQTSQKSDNVLEIPQKPLMCHTKIEARNPKCRVGHPMRNVTTVFNRATCRGVQMSILVTKQTLTIHDCKGMMKGMVWWKEM
mmetsp:Transcript_28053/g.44968  ORF Transcript_28053/g.44968 Transcript_28053/m.44968 type:complete len:82 (+) Transcript_28053:6246-6491(+)